MIALTIVGPRLRGVAAVALLCSVAAAIPAEAREQPPKAQPSKTQPPPKPKPPAGPTPRAGSWEISGGYAFAGGYDLDSATAELTRNTTTAGTGPFELFDVDPRLAGGNAWMARLGYYFSPQLEIEGRFRFARPRFEAALSGDAENAPDIVAEETLDQYVIDGSVLWHFLRRPASRSRLVPFVFGGGGYLRELHQGQSLVQTGVEYHAGGGVKYWLGNARRRFGIRGEGGIALRDGGADYEDKVRMLPVVSASLVYLF